MPRNAWLLIGDPEHHQIKTTFTVYWAWYFHKYSINSQVVCFQRYWFITEHIYEVEMRCILSDFWENCIIILILNINWNSDIEIIQHIHVFHVIICVPFDYSWSLLHPAPFSFLIAFVLTDISFINRYLYYFEGCKFFSSQYAGRDSIAMGTLWEISGINLQNVISQWILILSTRFLFPILLILVSIYQSSHLNENNTDNRDIIINIHFTIINGDGGTTISKSSSNNALYGYHSKAHLFIRKPIHFFCK